MRRGEPMKEGTDIVSCRSCKADIVFLRTPSGKTMPVNADTVEPGDTEYERGKHVSHFSTCSNADNHRRPR